MIVSSLGHRDFTRNDSLAKSLTYVPLVVLKDFVETVIYTNRRIV